MCEPAAHAGRRMTARHGPSACPCACMRGNEILLLPRQAQWQAGLAGLLRPGAGGCACLRQNDAMVRAAPVDRHAWRGHHQFRPLRVRARTGLPAERLPGGLPLACAMLYIVCAAGTCHQACRCLCGQPMPEAHAKVAGMPVRLPVHSCLLARRRHPCSLFA